MTLVCSNHGEATALARQRSKILEAALRRLSDEHRVIVKLRFGFDLPQSDVGVLMGLERSTIAYHEARALVSLRAALSRLGVDALSEIV